MFKRKKKNKQSNQEPQSQEQPVVHASPKIIMGKQYHEHKKKSKIDDSSFLNNGSPAANFLRNVLNKRGGGDDVDDGSGFKKYNRQDFQKTSIDLLGYKGLTQDKNHFLILADDFNQTSGYAEILRIQGTSLSDLPEELIYRTLSDFINFLRSYIEQFKFVSLPLPNDSRKQQHQWAAEYERVQDILLNDNNVTERQRKQLLSRLEYIAELLDQFKAVDLNLINQGFVLIVFGKNVKELIKARRYAFMFGNKSLNLTKMTDKDKETFLKRVNNPNIISH